MATVDTISRTDVGTMAIIRRATTSATTAINICQRIGGPVGTTGLAIFLHHMLAMTDIPETAYTAAMWMLAALAVLGMLAASRLPGPYRSDGN